MGYYEWVDALINAAPRYSTGFTMLLAAKPYNMPAEELKGFDSRHMLIRSFQETCLELFRAGLKNEIDPRVITWLMNETPESLGLTYHRTLEDRHFTLPVFFRTDEAKPGRLTEIQCPGSFWGELQLMFEYAGKMGYPLGDKSPADKFVDQLTRFLGCPPIVQHFLDKASAPAGMRYFIEKTRPGIKYWGIDRGVRLNDCNFIRHHAFVDLWTDLNLRSNLSRVNKGLTFDYPPHILFDQKATLTLPFWSLTRQYFTDEIRDLFPFTTPLLPGGIELQDGNCISFEEFSSWPKSERAYYLKLAGFNTELNWGSRAVYRLSNMGSGACLDFLQQCLSGYEQGKIWLLQKEEFQEDEITFATRDGQNHTRKLRAKFSGFYGPDGCLGVLATHRHHFKVHGQDETVASYVFSGGKSFDPMR